MPTELARAKINLNLHVGRLVEDAAHQYFGYHPLSSLVVFADFGDELSCEEAPETSLSISGPFAKALETDQKNLILRAYEAVSAFTKTPSLKFHLNKKLPVASGIGGGSADAAAALRLLQRYVNLREERWQTIALSLGADVPVCLNSRTCIMSGIGEKLSFLPDLGQLPAVLINPAFSVSTKQVFQDFDGTNPAVQPLKQDHQASGLLGRALAGNNDLERLVSRPKLIGFQEDIEFVSTPRLIRMSGSGATFFCIYDTVESTDTAVLGLKSLWQETRPKWWVQPVMLGDAA